MKELQIKKEKATQKKTRQETWEFHKWTPSVQKQVKKQSTSFRHQGNAN